MDQSDAGSAGIFSRWTHPTQEAQVNSPAAVDGVAEDHRALPRPHVPAEAKALLLCHYFDARGSQALLLCHYFDARGCQALLLCRYFDARGS
eukprot:4911690-Pyramimonas_sp.AAC.1